jgi:hypothetical protein
MAAGAALVLGALAALALPTPGGAAVEYGLELAAADISWRACRAGFTDARFAGVCAASGSALNPLHVAVTVSATWWAAPNSLGPNGPARWRADADPRQAHVLLPAAAAGGSLARSIGWKAVGDSAAPTAVPPNAAGAGYGNADAYAFAVTHAEQLSTKTNASLHHVSTRLSFMLELPHAGEFEVAFTGCCRWADLANIRQEGYPNKVPWRVMSTVRVSTDSALAPSFSPRIAMPITQVVLWHPHRTAFSLHADYGGELTTLVDDTDMAGRYLETESKMSLDPNVYVTTDTKYAAYVRDDGGKSIVWFQAPDTGSNQFGASGDALPAHDCRRGVAALPVPASTSPLGAGLRCVPLARPLKPPAPCLFYVRERGPFRDARVRCSPGCPSHVPAPCLKGASRRTACGLGGQGRGRLVRDGWCFEETCASWWARNPRPSSPAVLCWKDLVGSGRILPSMRSCSTWARGTRGGVSFS